MSEDKETKTPTDTPAPVPEAEYADPSWAAVEPDEVASVRLFVQVGVLALIIFVLIIGLWRFLKAQTSDQLKHKEARDANNLALRLEREAVKELQARSPNPATMRARMPVQEAIDALVRNPELFKPLSRPPKPEAKATKKGAPAPKK